MQISIASGKGGTGKTTLAVNLAAAASAKWGHEEERAGIQVLDCDVEEPNCHIYLRPNIADREDVTIAVPSVDETRCVKCGVCGEVCAFHAILAAKRVLVFPELCHGCGACSYLCPEECITEVPRPVGVLETGESCLAGMPAPIAFVHGLLNTGEALAAPVAKRVRKEAHDGDLVIIDSPPGTSCAMMASVKGSDLCILVTEPTPFGLHDLKLAYEAVTKLGIRSAVVINRAGIGDDKVAEFCKSNGVPVLAEIPLDKELARLSAEGQVAATASERYMSLFGQILNDVIAMVNSGKNHTEARTTP